MNAEFVRGMKRIDMIKLTGKPYDNAERDRVIRLYCYQSGAMWNLQIRAPVQLADRRDGKDFIVANASMLKDDLIALRDAINVALTEAES